MFAEREYYDRLTAGSNENKREKFEQNIFLVLETVGHQSMTFIVSCYMGIIQITLEIFCLQINQTCKM